MTTVPKDEQMPTPYLYFVSYAHARGFGSITVSRSHLVNSDDEVTSLTAFVRSKTGMELALIGITRLA